MSDTNWNRKSIESDLSQQPEKIAEAEARLHETKLAVVDAKDAYSDAECRLLLKVREDGSSPIDGKNEAIRQAQLKTLLLAHHSGIREAEKAYMEAERQYNLAINTFRALQSVAVLMGGEEK